MALVRAHLTLAGGLTDLHQFTTAEGFSPISGVVETPCGELAGVTIGSPKTLTLS